MKEIIQEFDLPKGTKFIAYLVHLPDSDEFLAGRKNQGFGSMWTWTTTPENAFKYQQKSDALRDLKAYAKKTAVIAILLDTGKEYFVIHDSN